MAASQRWKRWQLAGVAVRVLLFVLKVDIEAARSPILTTPASAIHRVREGLFLISEDKSPYEGDMFHQPPLVLALYAPLQWVGKQLAEGAAAGEPVEASRWLNLPFFLFSMVLDLGIATMLSSFAGSVFARRGLRQSEHKSGYDSSTKSQLSPVESAPPAPAKGLSSFSSADGVAALYFLHPICILSTLSLSTGVLTRFALVAAVSYASKRFGALSALWFAVAVYFEVWPLCILPVLLLLLLATRVSHSGGAAVGKWREWQSVHFVVAALVATAVLHTVSAILLGGGMDSVAEYGGKAYAWRLSVEDLTPNTGIFWYLLQLCFRRFTLYFTIVLGLHPWLYVLPLVYKLQRLPEVLLVVTLAIFGIYQQFPTAVDIVLPMSLAFMFPAVIASMRALLFFAAGIAMTLLLMPVMWHMWLYPGIVNANHFYFQNLGYVILNTLLVTEFLRACVHLERGEIVPWGEEQQGTRGDNKEKQE
eukprot:g3744.t1